MLKNTIISTIIATIVTTCCMLSACYTSHPLTVATIRPTPADSVVGKIPSWYINSPSTPMEVYQPGTGVSQSLSMSVAIATLDAQRQLADKLAARISSMTHDYKRDVGSSYFDDTEIITKKVVLNVLVKGYSVKKELILNENGKFRTYLLLQYSTNDVNAVINSTMRDLPGEAQAKKDLDAEIAKPTSN